MITCFLTLQINTDTFENSVDPDETARPSRLIRIYSVCHSVFDFRLSPLFASVEVDSRVKESISYPKETICTKCYSLYSGNKSKKKDFKMSSADMFTKYAEGLSYRHIASLAW